MRRLGRIPGIAVWPSSGRRHRESQRHRGSRCDVQRFDYDALAA
jgi:hypothetical protein